MRKEVFYFGDKTTLKQALDEIGECEGIKFRLKENLVYEVIVFYGDDEE